MALPPLDMSPLWCQSEFPERYLHHVPDRREKHISRQHAPDGWNDIFKTSQTSDHFFQIEGRRRELPAITFIAQHHRCPLTIAHCSRTGVSYQIDILVRISAGPYCNGLLSAICSRSWRVLFRIGSTILIFQDSAKGNSIVPAYYFDI